MIISSETLQTLLMLLSSDTDNIVSVYTTLFLHGEILGSAALVKRHTPRRTSVQLTMKWPLWIELLFSASMMQYYDVSVVARCDRTERNSTKNNNENLKVRFTTLFTKYKSLLFTFLRTHPLHKAKDTQAFK